MTPQSPIPPGMDMVVEAESLFHAQTLVAVLADHNIEAVAAPDVQHGAGIHPDAAVRPVAVLTSLADAVEARAILRDVADGASDIDWEQEITDPAGPAPISTGQMPLIARAGLIAGLGLIALMLIGAILMLIF